MLRSHTSGASIVAFFFCRHCLSPSFVHRYNHPVMTLQRMCRFVWVMRRRTGVYQTVQYIVHGHEMTCEDTQLDGGFYLHGSFY